MERGGGLQSLSCTSASFCATFDWSGRLFVFDGGHWYEALTNLVRGLQEPTDISCGARDFCLIANGDVVIFNGKSVRSVVVDKTASIDSISCVSRAFCGVVAGADAFIYDQGK